MRYKSKEIEWLSVKESDLWNLPQNENSILPALRLSYSHLPSKLKPCFAFCAVFPKDFNIEKEKLIHLWIANGFIQTTGNFEPEDIGNEICNELYWRSFFQEVKKDEFGNNVTFKMHDLVHDLAQSISKDECIILDAESSTNISKSNVHVRMDSDLWQSYCTSSRALYQVKTLRTLILTSRNPLGRNALSFSCGISRLISLRVFHVTLMSELPCSISRLKHLRYLDLSDSYIKLLPESLCSLHNLQTLNLKNCGSLQKLPKRMRCLKNLRHLYLNECFNLSQMPSEIGQITCLKTLTLFIVGTTKGCRLAELKGLNLGGVLRITHLDRVRNLMEAGEANLVGKPNLHHLELSWGLDGEFESREKVEKIFEALKPHPNIESLMIEGYKGVKFPVWMNNQILSNVVSITLSQCENCLQLPPLWQLPWLRHLTISELIHVEYIDTSFQGDKMMSKFPSLEELYIYQLPRLHRLSRQDGRESFPCLAKLQICLCPELTLPCLPSAKILVIYGCSEELLRSISNFRSLTHLYVDGIHDSIYLPHGIVQTLTSLHEMRIMKFRKFKGFPTDLVSLSALKSLHIDLCPEFEAFPEQVLEGLTSLQLLDVRECRKFSTLSEGLQHLSALKCLVLNGCPELVALPDGIKYLSSLRELVLSGKPTESYGQRKTTTFREMIVSLFSGKEFDCCPKLVVLPETLQHVPALQSLSIRCYPELASLPHWLGDLTSLQSLQIFDCPKLSTLPPSIQSLGNLQNLHISQCPELVKQCHKETGEDGYKIVHVPNIDVEA